MWGQTVQPDEGRMTDCEKSYEQLCLDLEVLRQRIAELEALEAQRRRAESQRDAMLAALQESERPSNAELQARNEKLDAFAYTVAHDLQNPLAIIAGMSEVLEAEYATLSRDELRKHLHTIRRSCEKMASIIDGLLLLAQVRMGEVEVTALDMGQIFAEVQVRLADLIEGYQARIETPDVWPLALGYAPWVEQVWINYLSNAIKYGGHPPHVEIGASVQADGGASPEVRFWVRDNGPGLALKDQNQLFSPFTRLDKVRASGYGLGLSIIRRLVEKLGGRVGIESEGVLGRGSVFSFTLPGLPEQEE
jgi:signal transduction histidine kinase